MLRLEGKMYRKFTDGVNDDSRKKSSQRTGLDGSR